MSAMVTSTSTPGSIEMEVICFTISDGECRSMRRLWMRISKRSHVLVPMKRRDGAAQNRWRCQVRTSGGGAWGVCRC